METNAESESEQLPLDNKENLKEDKSHAGKLSVEARQPLIASNHQTNVQKKLDDEEEPMPRKDSFSNRSRRVSFADTTRVCHYDAKMWKETPEHESPQVSNSLINSPKTIEAKKADADRDSTPELNNFVSPKQLNSNFSAGSDNSAQFFSPFLSPSQLSPVNNATNKFLNSEDLKESNSVADEFHDDCDTDHLNELGNVKRQLDQSFFDNIDSNHTVTMDITGKINSIRDLVENDELESDIFQSEKESVVIPSDYDKFESVDVDDFTDQIDKTMGYDDVLKSGRHKYWGDKEDFPEDAENSAALDNEKEESLSLKHDFDDDSDAKANGTVAHYEDVTIHEVTADISQTMGYSNVIQQGQHPFWGAAQDEPPPSIEPPKDANGENESTLGASLPFPELTPEKKDGINVSSLPEDSGFDDKEKNTDAELDYSPAEEQDVSFKMQGQMMPLHVKDFSGQQSAFGKIDSPRVMSIAGGPVFPGDENQEEMLQEAALDTAVNQDPQEHFPRPLSDPPFELPELPQPTSKGRNSELLVKEFAREEGVKGLKTNRSQGHETIDEHSQIIQGDTKRRRSSFGTRDRRFSFSALFNVGRLTELVQQQGSKKPDLQPLSFTEFLHFNNISFMPSDKGRRRTSIGFIQSIRERIPTTLKESLGVLYTRYPDRAAYEQACQELRTAISRTQEDISVIESQLDSSPPSLFTDVQTMDAPKYDSFQEQLKNLKSLYRHEAHLQWSKWREHLEKEITDNLNENLNTSCECLEQIKNEQSQLVRVADSIEQHIQIIDEYKRLKVGQNAEENQNVSLTSACQEKQANRIALEESVRKEKASRSLLESSLKEKMCEDSKMEHLNKLKEKMEKADLLSTLVGWNIIRLNPKSDCEREINLSCENLKLELRLRNNNTISNINIVAGDSLSPSRQPWGDFLCHLIRKRYLARIQSTSKPAAFVRQIEKLSSEVSSFISKIESLKMLPFVWRVHPSHQAHADRVADHESEIVLVLGNISSSTRIEATFSLQIVDQEWNIRGSLGRISSHWGVPKDDVSKMEDKLKHCSLLDVDAFVGHLHHLIK